MNFRIVQKRWRASVVDSQTAQTPAVQSALVRIVETVDFCSQFDGKSTKIEQKNDEMHSVDILSETCRFPLSIWLIIGEKLAEKRHDAFMGGA